MFILSTQRRGQWGHRRQWGQNFNAANFPIRVFKFFALFATMRIQTTVFSSNTRIFLCAHEWSYIIKNNPMTNRNVIRAKKWRRESESNRSLRICSPLPSRLAITPQKRVIMYHKHICCVNNIFFYKFFL